MIRAILKFIGRVFGGRDLGQVQQSLDDRWEREGYYRLPSTMQWTPGSPQRTDKEKWKSCEQCGRSIPIELDWHVTTDGQIEEAGTWSYVCPFCSHCHVGTPFWSEDAKKQERCHECGTKLGESYQCGHCSFPRGWMRVDCPICKHRQPVCAPHWLVQCDLFHLECVRCESVFDSLCIC
jgi:hypothetical protein